MNIKEIKETYTNISLKRICDELGLCYQFILKKSKEPITGKPYDPNEINYEAIDKVLAKKDIDFESIDWNEINEQSKKAEPINQISDFDIDTRFKLRESNEKIFEVIFITESHIVFMERNKTQPRVMNHDTFLHQSPRIVK